MKATGIVRRIDDLGRVVIPKEIRRTMRIREGDPLEIYTDHDGEVIFKKYSPIGELSNFSGQYAEVLNRTCGLLVAVTDRDYIISTAGVPKKELMEKKISPELEAIMESRQVYRRDNIAKPLRIAEGVTREALVAVPVLSEGDVIGCVLILANDANQTVTDTDVKLAQAAAAFFGKQMES